MWCECHATLRRAKKAGVDSLAGGGYVDLSRRVVGRDLLICILMVFPGVWLVEMSCFCIFIGLKCATN